VRDQLHAFHALFHWRPQWERKAYGAMAKEDAAARKLPQAKSASNRSQRLRQDAHAHQACEQTMARYDHLARLLQLLQEAWPLCTSQGKLRTKEGGYAERTRRFQLLTAMDEAALDNILPPIQAHLDDSLVPSQQAEMMYAPLLTQVPQQIFEALSLAWHHHHLRHQSQGQQTPSHLFESQQWRDVADGLLARDIAPIQTSVFDPLDAMIRASALVEMVHAFIRPSLNSSQGHSTQETVNLSRFSPPHHRDKSGNRKGKAPSALLTGKT
jgi:hypothetical protein